MEVSFEWDRDKEALNLLKHKVDFLTASRAFEDPRIRLFLDEEHSQSETRMFALGKVDGKLLTVRFVWRNGVIRIFGAGYWRKGEKIYEKK